MELSWIFSSVPEASLCLEKTHGESGKIPAGVYSLEALGLCYLLHVSQFDEQANPDIRRKVNLSKKKNILTLNSSCVI